MNKKLLKKLKKSAKNASFKAYSPYSKIKVGAAILTESNDIINGCNVENISFGGTICAERTAICKAVSEGHTKFKALYLFTKEQWTPCGICLQVMSEFLSSDTPVILGSDNEEDIIVQFKDLMPRLVDKKTFKKLQE